jgi:hypothetical protein
MAYYWRWQLNPKRTLKEVGFFRETHPFLNRGNRRVLPSIRDSMRASASPAADDICGYLRAGRQFAYTSSIPFFASDEDRRAHGLGGFELTDGIWLWPDELHYYVRRFHLSLPQEFVADMGCQNWQVRDVDLTVLQVPGNAVVTAPHIGDSSRPAPASETTPPSLSPEEAAFIHDRLGSCGTTDQVKMALAADADAFARRLLGGGGGTGRLSSTLDLLLLASSAVPKFTRGTGGGWNRLKPDETESHRRYSVALMVGSPSAVLVSWDDDSAVFIVKRNGLGWEVEHMTWGDALRRFGTR